MPRLKIAKAQAVITITETAATTNLVTTTDNLNTLGVSVGMPIVLNDNAGEMDSGTTYYIYQIVSSNTFTVSEKHPSDNPTVMLQSNESGLEVLGTINAVSTGYNNPAGYGVVGGNYNIYGRQLVTSAAFLQDGSVPIYVAANTTIVTSADGNIDIGDILTDGSILMDENGNEIGRVDTVDGLEPTIVETQESGNLVIASTNDMTSLTANATIVFSGNIGGIVEDTAYFVLPGAVGNAFQVSTTVGGAPIALTDDTGTIGAKQTRATLTANAAATINGDDYQFATPEEAYIVRQKGKYKYLVHGVETGITRVCYTTDVTEPDSVRIYAEDDNANDHRLMTVIGHNAKAFNNDTGNTVTGNVVVANATPLYVTFNDAEEANVADGILYPVTQVEGEQ